MRARWAIASSVADQGVAALTNIAVLVVAARESSAEGFAVFSLVYMTFTVVLGVQSSFVGQALVLERDGGKNGRAGAGGSGAGPDGAGATQDGPVIPSWAEPDPDAPRPPPTGVASACRSAVTFSALSSTAVGGTAALLLALVPGELAHGLAMLGVVLPVVLLHDVLRYCFAALRLPHHALLADLLRLVVAVPALVLQPDGSSPARLIAVWGASALPALLLCLALAGYRLRGARGDWRRYLRRGHLGRRFVVEFAVGNGATQLSVIGLGLVASQLAVGALRGATTLYGPMNVLYNSATSFGPPVMNRIPNLRGKLRSAAALAVLLAGTAAAWTTVLVLLPDSAGRELLGDTWASTSSLLPATGSQYAGIALGTSALLTLRVLRPESTLPIQVVFSLLSVGCMLTGYAAGGVLGAAWGLCAGSALKAAALWLRVAAVSRSLAATGPGGAGGSGGTAGSGGGAGSAHAGGHAPVGGTVTPGAVPAARPRSHRKPRSRPGRLRW
ncbi:hypothetical protein DMB38_07590 [Streptomyces sp. WAC 06738]|uniref:hypothetical protein n=1 Tax=Streptomyces sp. WAC 06738 TaxID=2203210 RepID=UPI000F705284|nr:hypothetical protein [Streptomyces sp. WAC 06738]AZM45718.1 hypothetical protein DMB38_07590 [Streptomyces sp. WAC 06738]